MYATNHTYREVFANDQRIFYTRHTKRLVHWRSRWRPVRNQQWAVNPHTHTYKQTRHIYIRTQTDRQTHAHQHTRMHTHPTPHTQTLPSLECSEENHNTVDNDHIGWRLNTEHVVKETPQCLFTTVKVVYTSTGHVRTRLQSTNAGLCVQASPTTVLNSSKND